MADNAKKPVGRPKKATPASNVDVEKEDLRKQLEEMREQVEQMRQMLQQPMVVSENAPRRKKDKMIRLVNLSNGTLVLRGSVFWKLEGQFATHDFLETEASIIVNNMANCVRDGYVYIDDADFVEEHNLADVYRYLLSDQQLKELLDKDSRYVVEAYKMANDAQKDIIIDMIEEKKLSGADIDANVLFQIGKLCGKDLLSDDEE